MDYFICNAEVENRQGIDYEKLTYPLFRDINYCKQTKYDYSYTLNDNLEKIIDDENLYYLSESKFYNNLLVCLKHCGVFRPQFKILSKKSRNISSLLIKDDDYLLFHILLNTDIFLKVSHSISSIILTIEKYDYVNKKYSLHDTISLYNTEPLFNIIFTSDNIDYIIKCITTKYKKEIYG